MEIAPSPRVEELTAKLQSAVSKDPEWWQEYVKHAPAGEALPYDSRMGLSEAEYAELLKSANAPKLRQVEEATLVFRWLSEAEVVVDGQGPLTDLTKIRIDLTSDSVTTDYGVLADRSEVNNTSLDSPTGPWQGVQWKLESGNAGFTSGVVAKLALGRLVQTGEGLLYFDAKEIEKGSLTSKSSYILFYPLPEWRQAAQQEH